VTVARSHVSTRRPAGTSPRRRGTAGWLSWLLGIALLGAVVLVAIRRAEAREFTELLKHASPLWLLAATGLQILTYLLQGEAWSVFLRRHGTPPLRAALFRLSFIKLFVDQVIPTASISGNAVMLKGLERRGVRPELVMAGVVVETVAYYIGYSLAVTFAALLTLRTGANAWFLLAAGVVTAATLALAWGMHRLAEGHGIPLGLLDRIGPVRAARTSLERADADALRDGRSLLAATLLQLAIHVVDAMTLGSLLLAVGTLAPPLAVFLGFMLASLVRTVGIVPGGLGTFEAVSVTMLRAAGVSLSAALTGTLLFRGFSFWLPMIPGWWLARHETRARRPATPAG